MSFKPIRKILSAPASYWFIFILIANLILFFLHQRYVLTNELLLQNLPVSFSTGERSGLIKTIDRFQNLAYPIMLISLVFKLMIISAVLYIGFYLNGRTQTYSRFLKAVCMADTIFLVPLTWKLLWFCFNTSYSFKDVEQFYPLSLLNLVDAGSLSSWWIYPLQIFNAFELGFMLLLAALIPSTARHNYDHSLKMVVYTYLPALISWTVIVMFITLITAS